MPSRCVHLGSGNLLLLLPTAMLLTARVVVSLFLPVLIPVLSTPSAWLSGPT
jgi:hypothetical protein